MMRGDSLRDFYAKSLALLGLAFLGALGAAVDYWPTNLSIPRTSEFDFQIATLRPLSNMTLPAASVVATHRVAPRPVVTVMPAPPPSAIVETLATNIPEAQSQEPGTVDLRFATPVAFTGLSASANSTLDLNAPDQVPAFEIAEVVPALPAQKGGMLSGFVSSISDGSSKAGAAIANGFQAFGGAVGGAVKKLLPFSRHDDQKRQMIRPIFTSTSAPGAL